MIKEILVFSSRVFALGLISILLGTQPVAAEGEQRAELTQLRAEIERLLVRVAELEARQAAAGVAAPVAAAAAPAVAPTGAPVPVTAAVSWRWSGDLRYRSETLDIEALPNRQRDRVRARIGFSAEVGEDVSAVWRASTSDGLDPRAANTTLDQLGKRKTIGIDLAYLRWRPGGADSSWQVTAGKMLAPWRMTPGFFFDTDVNPEGLAIAWQQAAGGPFASVYYLSLLERRTARDSSIWGAQLGWRGQATTVAMAYFDYQTVQGYDPFLDRNPAAAFGNSLVRGVSCRAGVADCLAQDFDVLQGLVDYRGELASALGGWPIRLHAEYALNLGYESASRAATGAVAARGAGDEAFSLGITLGETQTAGGWQWGLVYQDVERDALFAPWLDADFASGFSASSGWVWRLGYALTPRWQLNASWFDTERVLEGGADIREQRLHLDVNTRF